VTDALSNSEAESGHGARVNNAPARIASHTYETLVE
jgi:hypothetical protein